LYRWSERCEFKSRRPHKVCGPRRPAGLAEEVERLRLDFPMWGKAKIGPLVRELGFQASDSTVGRILSALIARGRAPAVPDLLRKVGPRAASKARPYAVRKPKEVQFGKPGDVVQIDTLSISLLPGRTIKQFTAYDPHAKWTVAAPYARATAKNAAEFLLRVCAQMPDPIKAIQIDGGSEFMAEFELACKEAKLPLYVLPPRSPKLNGAVERCNGAWRYEFYACNELPLNLQKLAQRVDAFQHLYNHHRPHGALAGLTPAKYLSLRRAEEPPPSHISRN
jgi:transposase InsO family protein